MKSSSNVTIGATVFENFFLTEYNLYSSLDLNPSLPTLKNLGVNNSLPV